MTEALQELMQLEDKGNLVRRHETDASAAKASPTNTKLEYLKGGYHAEENCREEYQRGLL